MPQYWGERHQAHKLEGGGGGGGGGFSKKVWLSLAVPMLIVLFRDLVKQGILA